MALLSYLRHWSSRVGDAVGGQCGREDKRCSKIIEQEGSPGDISLPGATPPVIGQNYGESPPVTAALAAAAVRQTRRQLHIRRIPLLWPILATDQIFLVVEKPVESEQDCGIFHPAGDEGIIAMIELIAVIW